MKREIWCDKCFKESLPTKIYAGEWLEVKFGKSRKEVICDFCGENINKGDSCTCRSLGLDSQEYYEWESEYIIFSNK